MRVRCRAAPARGIVPPSWPVTPIRALAARRCRRPSSPPASWRSAFSGAGRWAVSAFAVVSGLSQPSGRPRCGRSGVADGRRRVRAAPRRAAVASVARRPTPAAVAPPRRAGHTPGPRSRYARRPGPAPGRARRHPGAARHPGRLGDDHLPRRHDLDRHERPRRRRRATRGHARHGVRRRQRQQDLHRGADPRPRRRRPDRSRRAGRSATSRERRSTSGSPSGMLLDHTSGLDDFFLHAPIDKALQADPDAAWSVEPDAEVRRQAVLPARPGWHYSNTNYLYLGLIAERVTGVAARGRAPRAVLRPARPRRRRGTRRSRSRAGRSPTATGSPGARRSSRADRPVDEVGDDAVQLGRHRRGRGRARSRRPRGDAGPLGAAPLHGRGPRARR